MIDKTILKRLRRCLNVSKWFLMAILVTAFLFLGCEDPLEVENPNSLVEEDLDNPSAASAIASGALATTARGMAYMLAPYEAATDEVTWIGSRDAWRQLNFGNVTDFSNEFTDDAFKFLSEGRWMADKAVIQLEKFNTEGTLGDPDDLARAYLYAAFIRVYLGNFMDDYAFSDRREPAPAVGENNMSMVYEDAVDLLNKAEAVVKDDELKRRILGMRALAKHSRAVWDLLNPKGSTPANPYVDAGVDDATAALALMDAEYLWQLDYVTTLIFNNLAWQTVGREELAVVTPLPTDPIDGITDPRMQRIAKDYTEGAQDIWGDSFSPVTVISAREMHLIIAEAFIARGDEASAIAEINNVRALDGLTAYDPAVHTGITVGQMLQHERHANLFLQGKRLSDMYRFDIKDSEWQETSDAFRIPGSFLPITISEIQANPLISIPGGGG